MKEFSRVRHYHMVWNGKTNPNKLKRSIWEEYFAANQRGYNRPFPSWPKCLFQSEAHGFPVGLLARMAKRCTVIAEVKWGLNSVQACIIFSLHNCKRCIYNWDDLLSFNSPPLPRQLLKLGWSYFFLFLKGQYSATFTVQTCHNSGLFMVRHKYKLRKWACIYHSDSKECQPSPQNLCSLLYFVFASWLRAKNLSISTKIESICRVKQGN